MNAKPKRETKFGVEYHCPRCDEWQMRAEFYVRPSGLLHSWCKCCYSERWASYREERRAAA